jgi:hypothetical protein
MQKQLELFLRNANVVNQKNCLVEKNPRKFMRAGMWVTEYTVHIYNTISGLSLRGKIYNYADGRVETCLYYSCYGDLRISEQEYQRRSNIMGHIKTYGAIYEIEPPIKWFN